MIYQGTVKITEKSTIARETLKLRFQVVSLKTISGTESPISDFTFEAGQFISLQYTEKAWRAYSIASTPEEPLELVIRLVEGGVGSEILRKSNVGDIFPFKAPFGHFVLSKNESAEMFFCGTGTGIAPLRSMIKKEAENPNPRAMTLLYGGRNLEDLSYIDELEHWSPNLKIKLGLSQDTEAQKHKFYAENCRITKFLETEKFSPESEFYICGNGAMVKSVQEILHAKGILPSKIFMERFN